MVDESRNLIEALGSLSHALSEPPGDGRRAQLVRLAETLPGLGPQQTWLSVEDRRFLAGYAWIEGGDEARARAELERVDEGSPWFPESRVLLARLLSESLTEANEAIQTDAIYAHYRSIVRAYPHSLLAAYMSEVDSELRRGPGREGPTGGHPRQLGQRYDWQQLLEIGSLYEELGHLEHAVQAYGWSLQVRSQDEWLSPSAREVWRRVSEVYRRGGNRDLALRFGAKALVLPLGDAPAASEVARLLEIAEETPRRAPKPRSDRDALLEIARSLREMELFDAATEAVGLVEEPGTDVQLELARTAQGRADFLFEYRADRDASTVLIGDPLTWDTVRQAYEQTLELYGSVEGPERERATQHCLERLARVEELRNAGA